MFKHVFLFLLTFGVLVLFTKCVFVSHKHRMPNRMRSHYPTVLQYQEYGHMNDYEHIDYDDFHHHHEEPSGDEENEDDSGLQTENPFEIETTEVQSQEQELPTDSATADTSSHKLEYVLIKGIEKTEAELEKMKNLLKKKSKPSIMTEKFTTEFEEPTERTTEFEEPTAKTKNEISDKEEFIKKGAEFLHYIWNEFKRKKQKTKRTK